MGHGDFRNRTAKIYLDEEGYRVVCSSPDKDFEMILYGEPKSYAEDSAEDWCLGIIE